MIWCRHDGCLDYRGGVHLRRCLGVEGHCEVAPATAASADATSVTAWPGRLRRQSLAQRAWGGSAPRFSSTSGHRNDRSTDSTAASRDPREIRGMTSR
jgi:hypothetical protein